MVVKLYAVSGIIFLPVTAIYYLDKHRLLLGDTSMKLNGRAAQVQQSLDDGITVKSGHEFGTGQNRGTYATACEQSPNKQQIDVWLNEGRSDLFISRELERLGDKISDKSVAKYRKYRKEFIQKELEKNPVYTAAVTEANQKMIDTASKVQSLDVLKHLSDIITNSAEMLQDAMDEGNVTIRNVADMRMVQMTMLDALKLYGDTMLKAQRMQAVNDDPSLLKPTINVDVKSLLKEMLMGGDGDARTQLVDQLRAGLSTGDK